MNWLKVAKAQLRRNRDLEAARKANLFTEAARVTAWSIAASRPAPRPNKETADAGANQETRTCERFGP